MARSGSQGLPGVRHKVIALVSGGKDSCFSIMHAVANGHELVAVATLTPPAGVDELDSHMYQSVGTTWPPLIARALGLPHYTRVIRGTAVEQGAEYGSREHGGEGSGREGDETEDVTELLKAVLAAHPDATAVTSGAILSNYQRLRIEHVCQRLRLTSLAYLWQGKQLPLVTSMVSSGLEAVLVKVAGIGLREQHVGKTLGQLLPLLTRLEAMYGAHPAGEGGEYESLTLDCPLFSHRLEIVDSEVVVTDPEPSLVAYLRIKDARLVEKEGWIRPTVSELREMLALDEGDEERLADLDEDSQELYENLRDAGGPLQTVTSAQSVVDAESSPGTVRFGRHGRWWTVTAEGRTQPGQSVGGEIAQSMDDVKARLGSENLSMPLQSTHITLLLADMADFAEINAAYVKYFGTSPPSRACVAVPLPPGQRVRLEVVGFDDSVASGGSEDASKVGGRTALHVQSISYWAPANIGPYSQSVIVNSRVHVAGQIALRPPSLTLPLNPTVPSESPYTLQSVLALQHARRIVDALRDRNASGGGWSGWAEGCVAWWAFPEGSDGTGNGASVVRAAWKAWSQENGFEKAPVIFVRATTLPRSALAEFQVNLHTGRAGVEDVRVRSDDDDDDDDDETELRGVYASGTLNGAHWEYCAAPPGRSGGRAVIFLEDPNVPFELASVPGLSALFSRTTTVRAYHTANVKPSQHPLVQDAVSHGACWTGVPVHELQDVEGRQYPLALEIFAA